MDKAHEIRIWLFSRTVASTVGEAVLEAFKEDPELAPERLGPFEPYRIALQDPATLKLWRSEADRPVGLLGGERTRPARIGLTVSFGMIPTRPFHSLFWTADDGVLRLPGAVERIEKLFRRLTVSFDSYWGAAFDSRNFERQNVLSNFRHSDGSIEPYKIVGVDLKASLPGLYWLNFFGAILCKFIGTKAIKEAAPFAEEVGDGLVIKLAKSPEEMLEEAARQQAKQIRLRLGESLFFDITQPNRHTRAPVFPVPPTPPRLSPPSVPAIKDPDAFTLNAQALAAKWRAKHGVDNEVAGMITGLERELDALGLRAPSEGALGDYAAVLGQLVIERAGGYWVSASEPYIVTAAGAAVYPVSQILKRAVDPDASLANWLDAALS